MNVVLLRVGIDTGTGGINGPLFPDGSFDYVPIPDGHDLDSRTYGNSTGRHGRKLIEYFPKSFRGRMADQSIHFDPEFATFTYGDPTQPKAGLRRLQPGDMLVFYCGLAGWGWASDAALYIMAYFEVEKAGLAKDFSIRELKDLCAENFHVRHRRVFREQRERLVLVKGNRNSRLLTKAHRISVYGKDCAGKRLKILSPKMQRVFGTFGGKVAIQRSPPRWVEADYVAGATEFVRSLE
jgi:hypothetical protein